MKPVEIVPFAAFRQFVADELVVTVGEVRGDTNLARAEDDETLEQWRELIDRLEEMYHVSLDDVTPHDDADHTHQKLLTAIEAANG